MTRSRIKAGGMRDAPEAASNRQHDGDAGARPLVAKTARATVLFADLRGYTGLAERLAPARIVPLLDEFFGGARPRDGTARRPSFPYGGRWHDGRVSAWATRRRPAPAKRWPPATRCCRTSPRSPLVGGAICRSRSASGSGLHLGEVALGSLGPPGRKQTTLVGDTVNVAARLCSRARAGEVLLSCAVADGARRRAADGRDRAEARCRSCSCRSSSCGAAARRSISGASPRRSASRFRAALLDFCAWPSWRNR